MTDTGYFHLKIVAFKMTRMQNVLKELAKERQLRFFFQCFKFKILVPTLSSFNLRKVQLYFCIFWAILLKIMTNQFKVKSL